MNGAWCIVHSAWRIHMHGAVLTNRPFKKVAVDLVDALALVRPVACNFNLCMFFKN